LLIDMSDADEIAPRTLSNLVLLVSVYQAWKPEGLSSQASFHITSWRTLYLPSELPKYASSCWT
jgi:hypothetical protein